jgi:CAAX prenyl protease-like protein
VPAPCVVSIWHFPDGHYIINCDFEKVPIGHFTWPSFLISTALFGMEHNFFLAGMMAGVAYNLLLYYTRSLSQCIVAHAITNLALGIYVISTGKWYLW